MIEPDRIRPRSTDQSAASDRRRAVALALGAALLYLATAPALVNLDGLGYLKLLPHNFAAGHLLYMPLLRQATRLLGGDGLQAGRLVNALLGGTGLLLTYGIVRRKSGPTDKSRFAAAAAAAGLGLSYGYWVQGADIEAYTAAVVALLGTVRLAIAYEERPSLGRALSVGLLLGVAVLCHLSHVVLSPFVAWHLYRHGPRPKTGLFHAALALFEGGLLTIGCYAYAALIVRRHDLSTALRWVLTASHGFRQDTGLYRLADALYGLCKAIIYSPYLYESDAPRLLGQFTLGLLPLFSLVALLVALRRRLPPLPWDSLFLWIAPYALLGVAFFGSDTERWIFVLPALFWVAGALIAELPFRHRIAAALLGYLLVLNLTLGLGPAHRETWTRHRAEAVADLLRDEDLLIFPGHSWDEYIGFLSHKKVEPFPFSYYAARDGLPACMRRLEQEVALARARGGRVLAVRVFDERDDDPRGVEELKALEVDRGRLRALVAAAAGTVSILGDALGQRVVQLDPAPSP
jgi:hypothetical protein